MRADQTLDDARACLVTLASVPGIGPATLLRCVHDGPRHAWDRLHDHGLAPTGVDCPADPTMAAAAARLEPSAVLERHRRAGLRLLVHGEPGYPARLLQDPAPPALLFAQGDVGLVDGPTVAIVGTRNATAVGCELVRQLSNQLAGAGISVVSGLALGIDGAAHQALVAGEAGLGDHLRGRPIGVVAAGLDRPYPRRHRLLHQQVATHGLLLTEVPLGGQPRPWRFPARNRIIAGLADAVIVAESRSSGGSMSTVAEALQRGVTVLAVPGHPFSPAAAGTNDLIADGAAPVRDVEDVLVALGRGGLQPRGASPGAQPSLSSLSPVALAVLATLDGGPRTLSQVVDGTGTTLGVAAGALVELQSCEAVTRTDGWYQQTGRGARRDTR